MVISSLKNMESSYKGLVVFKGTLALDDDQIDAFLKDTAKPFIENVKDHYKWASTWQGVKLPIVDEINHHGYNLFYAKQFKEALDIFNWGLSLYPNNLYLYYSIGEVLQGSGDKQAALQYYITGLNAVKEREQILESDKYVKLIDGFKRRIKALDRY